MQLLDDPRVGLRRLTMQAVALRAGVGRATLYRWWPDKPHLVLDAYLAKSDRDTAAEVTGDLRTDLRAHLGHLAFALQADSGGPSPTSRSRPRRTGPSATSTGPPCCGRAVARCSTCWRPAAAGARCGPAPTCRSRSTRRTARCTTGCC